MVGCSAVIGGRPQVQKRGDSMHHDLTIIGPATKDLNIDYDGAAVEGIGGAVTFCIPAAVSTGADVSAFVKIAPEDLALLSSFPLDPSHLTILPSAKTTVMENQYFTENRERRKSSCLAQSDPISLAELPQGGSGIYHLAGLLYGDFNIDIIPALARHGKLSADMQGFVRHNVDGILKLQDWPEKSTYLSYFDFLKVDAVEAELLTGVEDRRDAARILCEMGANEVLLSYNEEMLVCDKQEIYTCPVKARNLSGRTGRGDTTTGAYLAMRALGYEIREALLYATACVSLKMESPGPFTGTKDDVEAYIQAFY